MTRFRMVARYMKKYPARFSFTCTIQVDGTRDSMSWSATSGKHSAWQFPRAPTTSFQGLRFAAGDQTGEIEVRNVSLHTGSVDRWIRDFEDGVALLNMSANDWTVDVGARCRRLLGTQDPWINNGKTGSGNGQVFTVPAKDGLVLVRIQGGGATVTEWITH